jgi:hypothetical protein
LDSDVVAPYFNGTKMLWRLFSMELRCCGACLKFRGEGSRVRMSIGITERKKSIYSIGNV